MNVCMSCMYVCIYVCMYVLMSCNVCNVCMHVCMFACMHVFMYASVQACPHASMQVCMFVMFVDVCIYTYLDFLWVSAWRAEEFFFSLFTSPFTFLEGFAGLGLLGYPSIMFCLAWRHLNQECLEEAFPVSSRVGFSLCMPKISYT